MKRSALLVLAACATPEEPHFASGGVQIDDDRVVYFGPARMQFGKQSVALPTELHLGGEDVLKPRDMCAGVESLIGVALYPAVAAIGNAPGGTTTAYTEPLQGPAIGRVSTEFTVPYSCDGKASAISGRSTFTFFNSAVVIRRDEQLIASTVDFADSSACGACRADPFQFTSFWAFKPGTVSPQPGGGCVTQNEHTIAIKFEGANAVRAETSNGGSFFEQELAPMATNWMNLAGHSSVSQMKMFYGTDLSVCPELMAELDDPPIQVNGAEVMARDGIYDATAQPHDGRIRIRTATPFRGGFAMQIDLGGASHIRVLLNNHDLYWKLETDADPHPLIWFEEGLSTSDEITIDVLD